MDTVPRTISDALAIATAQHRAGRLDLAAEIYRRILSAEPDCAAALHGLGLVAHQQGDSETAVALIGRAIALEPGQAEYHNNLGNALRAQGKLDEATVRFRQALQLNPDYAEAYNNLATVLHTQGNFGEALPAYRRALELKPDLAQVHYNLGRAYQDLARPEESLACYGRALQLKPDYPEACNNLGAALQNLGRIDEAVACCRRAVELKPDYASSYANLASALLAQGNPAEAVACCRRALELEPGFAEAHNNLAMAFEAQGRLDEAAAGYRRTIELKPDFAEAHNNLGCTMRSLGRPVEAVECCRRAVELRPDFPQAHSNFLFASQYREGLTLEELARLHGEYERRHAAPLRARWTPHANARDPDRRLRLGFVSPDFVRHPVGRFLVRVLENLDRSRCEVACYYDRQLADDMTARFRRASVLWRDVVGLSDERLSGQIRQDQVDVLFDLTGHTATNRLLTFARRPAPLQVSWIGYEGTTGLAAIDHLLADRHTVPPGAERYYAEKILRMPEVYVCFEPPAEAPPVVATPALAEGRPTFGSFNNPAKLNACVVATWARILRRVPRARLILKYGALRTCSGHKRLEELFAAEGIESGRVEFEDAAPYADYLARYGQVDVALDPFPFNGGVTTCEALWMGVPVVTCPGETFAGRHSLSYLTAVGLTETIAADLDAYVEIAVGLAEDLPRLAEMRAALRRRMAESPLCDGRRFAEDFLRVLRGAWRTWTESP